MAAAPQTPGTPRSPRDIDEYIARYPDDIQQILTRVRDAIRDRVPGYEEKIRYGMPAIMLGGRYAVHFAAWTKHIGLYPIPTLAEPLESQIAPYREAKDTVNFPYANPIPYDLIARVTAAIVAMRRAT